MTRLLFVMLLLVPVMALADAANPCNVPAPSVPAPYTDWQKGMSNVQCAPKPVGTGTLPYIRANQAGMMIWMWCPVPVAGGTSWALSRVAATWSWLSVNNVATDGAAIAASANPITALNSALNKNVTLPLSDPSLTPVWCPYESEVWASRPADIVPPPPPPTVKYVSAGSGAIYSTSGGKLVRVLAGRVATPGAACNSLVPPIMVGASTYLPLAGGPTNEATFCKVGP